MLLISVILWAHMASAAQPQPIQARIDAAFQQILQTPVGRGICHDILGADAKAIAFHLGVSPAAATEMGRKCEAPGPKIDWIFPTDPSDIRKLTLKNRDPRHYLLMPAEPSFPIESWTDPFTNTTYLMEPPGGLAQSHLVRLLAHETAVYFDSKADPSHPDAEKLPALQNLKFNTNGKMNPLIAATDPLVAHTLTFVRALQVEASIADALKLSPDPDAASDNAIISDQCGEICLQNLIASMRRVYEPISLPLLAFSPQFRAQALSELVRLQPAWNDGQWSLAEKALNELPVEFLRHQFTGNPVADLQAVFLRDEKSRPDFKTVQAFLAQDLWPLEEPALMESRLPNGEPLLEFLKKPLLSGYNISLSSGPRVRVRTGNGE